MLTLEAGGIVTWLASGAQASFVRSSRPESPGASPGTRGCLNGILSDTETSSAGTRLSLRSRIEARVVGGCNDRTTETREIPR